MKRSPKLIAVLRWLLLSLAGGATLLALFVAVENWRGDRAWRAKRAELIARGEPFDPASFRPPSVPDDLNFFKAPLLARILYDQPENSDRKKLIADSHLSTFGTLQRYNGERLDLPGLRDQLQKLRLLAAPGSANAAAEVLEAMQPLRALLDDLRDAGRQRPQAALAWSVHPLEAPSVGAVTLFHLSVALSVRARLEIELGQVDEACDDIVALQRLANGLAAHPSNFLHLMVGVAMHTAAADAVSDGCRQHVWTDERLRQFQSLLGGLRPVGGFRDAMQVERAQAIQLIDAPPKELGLGTAWPWWLFRGWSQQNKVVYCQRVQDTLLARVSLTPDRVFPGPHTAPNAVKEPRATFYSPYEWVARLSLTGVDKMLDGIGSAAERLNLSAVAWALERYQLRHGKYPATLAELVPAFLAAEPTGIVNGLPLHLSLSQPSAPLIYSAGWDAKDDGGAQDDIVLKLPEVGRR
jgi:hypothetical protein